MIRDWKPIPSIALMSLMLLTTAPLSALTAQDTSVYRFAIPGKNWSLNIPSSAFSEGSEHVEGEARVFAGARAGDKKLKLSPVIFNIRMEPAKATGDAQLASDFAKKNLQKKSVVVQESIKQTVYNNIPVIRYTIDISPNLSPQMGTSFPRGKTFQAYYVKDDIWITVQLNFLEFRKEDEKFFFSLLDSLRIEDIPK